MWSGIGNYFGLSTARHDILIYTVVRENGIINSDSANSSLNHPRPA